MLMPCRYIWLKTIVDGYLKTGFPLISYVDGNYNAGFVGDDVGIYIIIPKLVHFFSLSLDTAISLFLYSIIVFSFISALFAFCYLCNSWLVRIFSVFQLSLLYVFVLKATDLYCVYVAAIIGIVPWIIYFLHNERCSRIIYLYYFSFGAILGVFHYIRAYSFLPSLVFIVIATLFSSIEILKKKMILIAIFGIGFLMTTGYFTYEYNKAIVYMKTMGIPDQLCAPKNHPFWHTIYLGFGFLNYLNKEKIEWSDECGFARIPSEESTIYPYCSSYEQILKKAVIEIVKNQPFFFLATLFAKIGVLLMWLFFFGNISILLMFITKKPLYIECAFGVSILTSIIFPLLSLPVNPYFLSFASSVVCYNITTFIYWYRSYEYIFEKYKAILVAKKKMLFRSINESRI